MVNLLAALLRFQLFDNFPLIFSSLGAEIEGKGTIPQNVEMVMPGDNLTVVFNLSQAHFVERRMQIQVKENGKVIGFGMVTEILE